MNFNLIGEEISLPILSHISTLFNKQTITIIGNDIDAVHDLSYNVTNSIITKGSTTTSIDLDSRCIYVAAHPEAVYNLYQMLAAEQYAGFLIVPRIWESKEMRDTFWYQIDQHKCCDYPQYKITLITFSGLYSFQKPSVANWTLVTAYFNLTRCPDASAEIIARDKSYYLSYATSTLSLPYNLIIYCDAESEEAIRAVRPAYLADKTRYIICEFDAFTFDGDDRTFADYRNQIIMNRITHPYQFDNRNTASYYLFCMSRYIMLKKTIVSNPFHSTHFCWINFCMERMGISNIMRLEEALAVNRAKFSTCYIDYVPKPLVENTHEYFRYGRCGMCSGFFTGNAHYMYKVCDLIGRKFLHYVGEGYGHADEQLYSPVYFENPDLFDHYYGDYCQMITNYARIYENAHAPIYNFIKNSFQYENYQKCREACTFVINSYWATKCDIDEHYLERLYGYMTALQSRGY